MSVETLELESAASFDEIVSSFLHSSTRMERIRRFAPLGLILLVQALLSLRLQGSVSQDEALYINDGRYLLEHWLHGAPMPDNPGSYFSGAPALYPVFAGWLDSIGGVQLVRDVNLVFMLATTVCVYLAGQADVQPPGGAAGGGLLRHGGADRLSRPLRHLRRPGNVPAGCGLCLSGAYRSAGEDLARRGCRTAARARRRW